MKPWLFLIALCFSVQISAQDYFYLEEIKLKKKSSFKEHESTVLKAYDYLLSTPIDNQNLDRSACIRFLIRYAEKTPFISIEMDSPTMKLTEQNTELLAMFIGGWLKTAIAYPDHSNDYYRQSTYTELYTYCKGGNGVKKTKPIQDFIAAGDRDEISTWITSMN